MEGLIRAVAQFAALVAGAGAAPGVEAPDLHQVRLPPAAHQPGEQFLGEKIQQFFLTDAELGFQGLLFGPQAVGRQSVPGPMLVP